ncbi:unnamed protein product [Cylindrotheca closterium]|uniref:RNA ligase domain-containing protein n=1 Tax=Cylindrotheca closterium TaxID=2856 RepID=A0AAD2PVJ2_9STRA|nr:unnamed protein product [Cylindrotheca closterium]
MIEESIDACDRIRKLASVQTVSEILPHPNADRLELATILGWQVVVAKAELIQKGDKVVYCEIDSKLPSTATWLPEAVKRRIEGQKNKKDWFHVKTAMIRGQLSQGLIVLMKDLEEELEDGHDMTAKLGIEKYDDEETEESTGDRNKIKLAGGNCWKPFPKELVPKTDEPRIQSNPWMLQSFKESNSPYYATVKLDGSSGTFLIDPKTDEFWVCSRNHVRFHPNYGDDSPKVMCPYWEAAKNANLEAKLREHNKNLAIQGEVCGPRIAKNPLGLDRIKLFVFDIYDLKTRRKLPFAELVSTCVKLGLTMVPVECVGDNSNVTEHVSSIGNLLEASKGIYESSGNVREGLVLRSMDQKISFKVINNDYLLGKKSKKKK